jgi:hypothetical protein
MTKSLSSMDGVDEGVFSLVALVFSIAMFGEILRSNG